MVSCSVLERRLQLNGYVMHIDENSCIKRCYFLNVEETCGRKPGKMWDEVVRSDLQMLSITEMTIKAETTGDMLYLRRHTQLIKLHVHVFFLHPHPTTHL